MSFGVIRKAISDAIPAKIDPTITNPAFTESELVRMFWVASPNAAASDAAVVPSVGNKALAGTKSSPSTTCGKDADSAACTNRFNPKLIRTRTANRVFAA